MKLNSLRGFVYNVASWQFSLHQFTPFINVNLYTLRVRLIASVLKLRLCLMNKGLIGEGKTDRRATLKTEPQRELRFTLRGKQH